MANFEKRISDLETKVTPREVHGIELCVGKTISASAARSEPTEPYRPGDVVSRIILVGVRPDGIAHDAGNAAERQIG